MAHLLIHRGTSHIGGIVTEISDGTGRILIDLGALLPGTENAKISDEELLQTVFGSQEDADRTLAVLFTHYHGDHIGLKGAIDPKIPLYIGPLAKEILKITAERVDAMKQKTGQETAPELPVIERMKTFDRPGRPLTFGDLRITPLVCDHSAVDAYMFLIEAAGKRILYTGDFRDHGIPGEATFEQMIRSYVGKVDLLVTEGTMVSRIAEERANPVRTEAQLGVRAKQIFSAHHENVVLVSSTNLDSVMEFYHATPDDKAFLCDGFQAEIIQAAIAAKNRYYPRTYCYRKGIYVLCPGENPFYMRKLKDYVDPVSGRKPFRMALPEKYEEKGFVMLARPNRDPNREPGRFEERMQQMRDPFITYSLWGGYRKGGKAEDPHIVRFLEGRSQPDHLESLHTSGHAYVEALRKLMDLTDPAVIIPMHTEDAKAFEMVPDFAPYQSRIRTIEDGECYML